VLMKNSHFRPQHSLLTPDRTPYTRVYRTSELGQAMQDLQTQVTANGGGAVPALASTNETPLKPVRSAFTDEVLAAIRQVYAEDFRSWFDKSETLPVDSLHDGDYAPAQLAEIGRLVALHGRIGRSPATHAR
jgi:hypothetical protein